MHIANFNQSLTRENLTGRALLQTSTFRVNFNGTILAPVTLKQERKKQGTFLGTRLQQVTSQRNLTAPGGIIFKLVPVNPH